MLLRLSSNTGNSKEVWKTTRKLPHAAATGLQHLYLSRSLSSLWGASRRRSLGLGRCHTVCAATSLISWCGASHRTCSAIRRLEPILRSALRVEPPDRRPASCSLLHISLWPFHRSHVLNLALRHKAALQTRLPNPKQANT